MKFKVLYEDNHLIVVEKPVNVLSQSDSTKDEDLLTMIKKYLKEKYHKQGNVYLGLVHRLDRPVGGIMVFAKTSKAASRLSLQIKNHEFKKYYLAITSKVLKNKTGEFIDYLIKDCKTGNSKVTSEKGGKKSILKYRVLQNNKNHSLVEVELLTGRHHQIRVQFASHGYPLCGDQRYGQLDHTQIALYSYKIKFIHPVTKKMMEFTTLPKRVGYWTEFTL